MVMLRGLVSMNITACATSTGCMSPPTASSCSSLSFGQSLMSAVTTGPGRDAAAQRYRRVLRHIAYPIVRQVGAGQHQIARLELDDEVADEIAAAGGDDEMQLVFRMGKCQRTVRNG